MPRGKLPAGFGKTLKALYAQGYSSKDAFREAWKIHKGSGPGMTRRPLTNPGARYHLAKATEAHLKAKQATDKEERDHDIGQFEAHLESAQASRKAGLNPKHKGYTIHVAKRGRRDRRQKYYIFTDAGDKRFITKRQFKFAKKEGYEIVYDNPGKPYRHAVSERQRRFMGAELGRRRAGKRTQTGMTTKQLREFARKPRRQNPAKWIDYHHAYQDGKARKSMKEPPPTKEELKQYSPTVRRGYLDGYFGRKPAFRKNPIAVYNPQGKKLPLSNVEIRYQRSGGEYRGEWFRHPFKSSVEVYGLENGSILIKSKSGKKLWGTA